MIINGDWSDARNIREAFKKGVTLEQAKIATDPKFDKFESKAILYGFKEGLTDDQMKMVIDPEISDDTMYGIIQGFKEDLTDDQIQAYCYGLNYDYYKELIKAYKYRFKYRSG